MTFSPRHPLPHQGERLYITDGGLESALMHRQGLALPACAAFVLIDEPDGRDRLWRHYARHARIACEQRVGLVLETPTWRASSDWGRLLGYDASALVRINRAAVDLMLELRVSCETGASPMPISGTLGPRGDAGSSSRMSPGQARGYHAPQIHAFAASRADLVCARTLGDSAEAIGIVAAARACGLPVVVSFTVDTDGRLPSGETLCAAIGRTDAQTDGHAAYFMVDCAHPVHFAPAFAIPGAWQRRVLGLRANASRRSHAELEVCRDLDEGDPAALGLQLGEFKRHMPWLRVLGGCCGTDHRHLDAICRAARHVSRYDREAEAAMP
ncbi:homocysteine S-methyltransferase family protein [Arenimonas terrae]|uniref:Homocysteine S-methyltransferase n=1 Tax=Arenimonas terrae TaxID=2546226 RepID=A0A5C4RRG4_9GAMM|nr:homocysteine S-methyltransferase family protein [Arenimonas terrae]TNJ33903.1 homocysteine S-methyltransferase [Arenimonas terrae]